MASARYRIYGFEDCPFCRRAKALLEEEGIPFDYAEINDTAARSVFLDERGMGEGQRTFPRIYRLDNEKEELVGGYAELEMEILLS